MNLNLSEANRIILFGILKRYRGDFQFFAFGSRVKGTHKKYSDLDLAVKHNVGSDLTQLKNELEESELSITVDIVDLNTISHDFKKLIEDDCVEL